MGFDEESREKLISIMDRNGQVISVMSGHNHQNTRIDGGNQRDHISVASTIQYPIGYSIIDLYDEGAVCNLDVLPKPALGELREGGFGLHIAGELVDELTYTPAGAHSESNHWRRVKKATEGPVHYVPD